MKVIYIILNILAVPLVFVGLYNFFKDFCAMLERGEELCDKYWQFVVYLVINIAGYAAIAWAIVQLVKWNI